MDDISALYPFLGDLVPFIEDINITDINCNGRSVWVNDVEKGRHPVDINFGQEMINKLAYKISNTENKQFNKVNPKLEADYNDLRFHFTHESFSTSGSTVSIRKTPVVARIKNEAVTEGEIKYVTEQARQLLENFVRSRLNIVVCGMTGSGKTEAVKYLMGFTNFAERIITLEDTLELHLWNIYPEKDIVELKINEHIDYVDAIKSSMRMLPVWLLLSEARGKEIKELLQCISTGAKIVTTIHTDNARQIPQRMLNMFEENELDNEGIKSMIYDYLNIGVHIHIINQENKTIRYIDQIVYFDCDPQTGEYQTYDIYRVKKKRDGTLDYQYFPLPGRLNSILEDNDFFMEWKVSK